MAKKRLPFNFRPSSYGTSEKIDIVDKISEKSLLKSFRRVIDRAF